MSDSDRDDSSFEVLEDEISPTNIDSNSLAEECYGTDSEKLWDSFSHISQVTPDELNNGQMPTSSESSWVQENSGTADFDLSPEDRILVVRPSNELDRLNTEPCECRQGTSQILMSAFTGGNNAKFRSDIPVVPVCIAICIGLFAVSCALYHTTVRLSNQVAILQDEIASIEAQHAGDLATRTQRESAREMEFSKALSQLNEEREKLHNELRIESQRHAKREAESELLILELQTERRKLMDTISAAESNENIRHPDCKTMKSHSAFMKKLHKMKRAFRELYKQPLSFPSMQRAYEQFCKIFRFCPYV